MTKKKIAIAVIHGMGSQDVETKLPSSTPTFSRQLRDRIRKQLGAAVFDNAIAWREIVWADVLQQRQQEYLKKIKRKTGADMLRGFVMTHLSDAASYRKTPDDKKDEAYEKIHKRVSSTIAELDSDVVDGAPLIVLAHSLGGHVMSNYIYDQMKHPDAAVSGFQNMRTMGGFVTFGCNIPIFTFAYNEADIFPIKYPGVDLPANKRFKPWWHNYYDKDDVLGYPLKDIGENYKALVENKELVDKAINAGGFITSLSPFSHNGYWKDSDFYVPAAKFIKRFL